MEFIHFQIPDEIKHPMESKQILLPKCPLWWVRIIIFDHMAVKAARGGLRIAWWG